MSVKNYVPRHIRLGVCCSIPDVKCFQDVREEIPVVEEDGSVVQSFAKLVPHPVEEVMSKYDYNKFRLQALLDAGVPLKQVNINPSMSTIINDLESVAIKLDSAEKAAEKAFAVRAEKESWFKESADSLVDGVEPNEIY